MKTLKWVLISAAALFVIVLAMFEVGLIYGLTKLTEDRTIENIMTRTSVRSYTSQSVEPEKVETMLRAAMAAPTAGNKQPWFFVVIDDKAILEELGANLPFAKMTASAPLAIVPCGDLTKTFEGEGVEYWVQDLSASTENLLLAAHSMGLGAVWTGVYPISERTAFVQKTLNLPENIVPLCVIPIGYPDSESTPKDKWNPDLIQYNR